MCRRALLVALLALVAVCSGQADRVLVHIPMDEQINLGLGDAIYGHSSFGADGSVGFCRTNLAGGSWYSGPSVDLVKAGYGPCVDMSLPGSEIRYTARYYQGGGNSNPYADAPIFVTLRDANWAGRSLGISYGPHPYPLYPEWVSVVDDTTPDGGDPWFDPSKVVRVEFFGTDWAGAGQDYIDIRDLEIVVGSSYDPAPIGQTKMAPVGSEHDLCGVVTAVFPNLGMFYVQSETEPQGIRVASGALPVCGDKVLVKGTTAVDSSSHELYVEALDWDKDGQGAVSPMFIHVRRMGGAPAGAQSGVYQGLGANNVGMLVKVYGEVLSKTANCETITLSDASGLGASLRVNLGGLSPGRRLNTQVGERIIVTGISSLYADEQGKIRPLLMCRGSEDYESFFTAATAPPVIKVAVINFDPHCPGYGNKLTHEVFGWNDPHQLVADYISDMRRSSGGWCQYEVVSWYDAEYYPRYDDGFQFTPDGYVLAKQNQMTHSGSTDHANLMSSPTYLHNQPVPVSQRVSNGEFDEVWLMAGPGAYAGWEASMVGPHPFFVNGGVYTLASAQRNFVVMGFNYERGVDCMLEDFVHRAECTMSQVYGPPNWWFPTYPAGSNWDRFRMIELKGPGESAVGMCHYSPNSASDYDWGNMAPVLSMCDDWLTNWPNLLGASTKRTVDATEWGGGDQRLHHIWWLERIPRAAGINPDGVQNNWWKYFLTHWLYPETD